MKKSTLLAYSVLPLLVFGMTVAFEDADALKSKGTSLPEVGSSKVCGDRLCSETSDAKTEVKTEHRETSEEEHQHVYEEEEHQHDVPSKEEASMMMMMITASPLPETAYGPAIDYQKGYLVEEIKDGLYWVTEGYYQGIFLTTGQGVIAVDAPPSIGENYLKAIAEVTDEPITHVVYSHSHTDHIGSANMFPDNAVIIAHQATADQLIQRQDPNRPVPTVTFDDTYTLEVGTQKLELEYKGIMHEPGNIFIYAPEQKVLMLVDIVFPGWTPFADLAMAEDVPNFIKAHDLILEYDFETFVGGHLTRLGTPEDVKVQKQYFEDMWENAAIANKTVDFMEIAQKTGFENPWLLFSEYMNAITDKCTELTESQWIGKLGAVDIYTESHCWKITESQRID